MSDSFKLGGKEAVAAALADEVAEHVQAARQHVNEAGKGLLKVIGQLDAGVPQGNEVFYLLIVQARVNEALLELHELNQTTPPEDQGPKIIGG